MLTGAQGFRSGLMQVYDTQTTPWRVLKSWKAHTDAVLSIMIDIPALWTMSRLTVVTTGADGAIRSWNGFLGSDYIGAFALAGWTAELTSVQTGN
jgi:hypothetical protein